MWFLLHIVHLFVELNCAVKLQLLLQSSPYIYVVYTSGIYKYIYALCGPDIWEGRLDLKPKLWPA